MVTSALAKSQRVPPWAVAGGALILIGVLSLVLGTGAIRASASTLGGTATIVDETFPATGASTDLFTVTVPTGAACTGSSNSGYYEYSYLIPQGAITSANFATTLTFNGLGEPSQGLGLPESPSGDLFEAVSTAPPTTSGGPGEIANVPADFQWAQLITQDDISLTGSSGLLYDDDTSGVWESGIACALNGTISDYWNTEVTFSASSTDPNGFTWAAVPGGSWLSGETPTTSTTTSPTTSTTTSPTTVGSTAPATVDTTPPSTTADTTVGASSALPGLGSATRARSSNSTITGAASAAGAVDSGGSGPTTGGSPGSGSTTAGSGGSGTSESGSSPGSSVPSGPASSSPASSGSPVHVYLALAVVLLGLCMCILGLLAKSSAATLEVVNP